MKFKRSIFWIKIGLVLLFFTTLHANEIQLITTHKKSNGTLLRIVTSQIMDIENIPIRLNLLAFLFKFDRVSKIGLKKT